MQPTRNQPKRRGASLSTERVLNSSSPIGRAEIDLLPFFRNCITNWDTSYSEEEQKSIISAMPTKYQTISKDDKGRIICPLTLDMLAKDQFFRDGTARFQRDICDGYWTATWRHNATKASEERAKGKFDDYLEQCIADMFEDANGKASTQDDDAESSDGDFQTSSGRKSKERSQRKKRSQKQKNESRRMEAEVADINNPDVSE